MQKKKTGTIFTIIGVIIIFAGISFGGIFFLVSAVSNGSVKRLNEEYEDLINEYEKTRGVISEVDDGVTYISYEDDYGDEYEISFNMSSSSYSEGTKVTVYYDEDDPNEAIAPEFEANVLMTLKMVLGIIGVVTAGIISIPGIVLIIIGAKLKKDAKKSGYMGA